MSEQSHSEAVPGSAGSPRFATTSWSVIAHAKGDDTDAKTALEQLFCAYWFPLYVYLRRNGHSRQDAEDLTQGFLVSLLEKDRWQAADAQRGRFRTFLLCSLDHFVTGQWRREMAEKRGGGQKPFSIDFLNAESRFEFGSDRGDTPEKEFDRAWALEILDRALASLRAEYVAGGKEQLFSAMSPFLATTDPGAVVAVASELAMSMGAVRVALHRLRQRYRERLRELVGQTVTDEKEIDEEIQELFRALG